jgi:hypothetical protein
MSSQGKNALEYRERNLIGVTGVTGGSMLSVIPTQFSSDATTITKNVCLYREYAGQGFTGMGGVTGANTENYSNPFVVPVDYRIVQSNQNTKSYQFGYITCRRCINAFPNNRIGR